jgi:ferritin heavy chain
LILEASNYKDFSAFANENLAKSFEYLFLSAQFGTFSKDRPGFKKVFDGLAEKAWNNGIEIIKEAAKRGVSHDFSNGNFEVKVSENVDELSAMGAAVEIEKNLLKKANDVHRHHSHASTHDAEAMKKGYDAGISHYIEEEVIEGKTETVRNLVGYVNDLMKLWKNNKVNFPMSLYLFDQYLQK